MYRVTTSNHSTIQCVKIHEMTAGEFPRSIDQKKILLFKHHQIHYLASEEPKKRGKGVSDDCATLVALEDPHHKGKK